MYELKKRVISALLFGPLIVACFYFLPSNAFFFFILVISLLASYELMSMSRVYNPTLIYLFSFLSFLILHFLDYTGYVLSFSLFLGTMILVSVFLRRENLFPQELLKSLETYIFSSLFIFFPLYGIYSLKVKKTEYAISLLFSVWFSDILAYFFGGIFGRHKLSLHISPGKTFEGLIGAVLGPIIVLTIFKSPLDFSFPEAFFFGIILGFLAQAGDLLESSIKRIHNVKDSSRIIPGHGGILDRIDSFIFTAPIFNYILSMRS